MNDAAKLQWDNLSDLETEVRSLRRLDANGVLSSDKRRQMLAMAKDARVIRERLEEGSPFKSRSFA